jgi:hypothetical protein
MKQTLRCGGGGENKQRPHGDGGESMKQTLRSGGGGGVESWQRTHCGGEHRTDSVTG